LALLAKKRGNRLSSQLVLDLLLPVSAASHLTVDPKVEYAALHRRLQEALHEAQPFDFAVAGLYGLIRMRVAAKRPT